MCLLDVLCCPSLLATLQFVSHRLLSGGDGASEFIGTAKKVDCFEVEGRAGGIIKYYSACLSVACLAATSGVTGCG